MPKFLRALCSLTEYIPFGDIWVGEDGALHGSVYHGEFLDPTETFRTKGWRSWHIRSGEDGEDGETWSGPLRLANATDGSIVTAWYASKSELRTGYHMGVSVWRAPASE